MIKNKNEQDARSFEKAKSIIISIIIAIVLWVAIINIVNPDVTTTIYDIPIESSGISTLREKGLVMVNADKLPTCSVTIRGKRNDIIESKSRIYAVINVSDIMNEGTSSVPVVINSPSSLNLEKQSVSNIKAEIETRREKEIPVSVLQKKVPEDKLIKTVPENQSIRISGSQKDLEKIHGCQVVPDMSSIKTDSDIMYSFVYLDHDGNQIKKPSTVHSTETSILLSHTVYDKKTTKPNLILPENLDENFRTDINKNALSDKKIIYGVKSDLSILSNIDFTFSMSDIVEGENKIALSAEEIENVYIPENQLTLDFHAEKLYTKEVSVDISYENLDAELYADIIGPFEYTLTGTKSELKKVEATVDLSDATLGTQQVPLKFKNKNLQPDKTYLTTVIINRKDD